MIGWPVDHSRSPLIHNFWIEEHKLANAHYGRLAVPIKEAEETFEKFAALGLIGANVTVPHKQVAYRAMSKIGQCDETARRLGAVNTIVKKPDGTFEGRNTDGYGFIENLKDQAPDWHPAAGPCTLLGAGGAARAIAAALEEAGVKDLRIVNRTKEKAESLIADLNLKSTTAYAWADLEETMSGANLLVNTTSLGMVGKDPLAVNLEGLSPAAIVYDIVYTPLHTGLLLQAKEKGHACVDGLGMLLHQAVPGFTAWFGVTPKVTPALRDLLLKDLGETT